MRRAAGRRAPAVLAVLLVVACAAAPPSGADLTNPQLSPALSQWLVGPIAGLASPEEVRRYLALSDDAAAGAFIEAFWARRDPDPARAGNPMQALFEQRAHDADRRFSEAGYLGRRTDRGTIFVLYGEPKKTDFEINPRPGQPPVERWSYVGETPLGLNGRAPSPVYRFVKHGDLTVLYNLPPGQRDPIVQPPPGGF